MNLASIMGNVMNNPQAVGALAKQFGVSDTQAKQISEGLMGALAGGVERNVKAGGLEGLMGALDKGNHEQYAENPDTAANPQAMEEGNRVLGHILGSKESSRAVAGQVGAQSGVSPEIIKKMLPMVAMMAMGSMAKGKKAQGNDLMGSLSSMLDQDGDGSPLNDIMGMLGGRR